MKKQNTGDFAPSFDIRRELFSSNSRHPYYILAPRYTSTSAGVSALYKLCHLLNTLGEEAFIVTEGSAQLERDGGSGLRAPVLSQQQADGHFDQRRVPIVIYPETSTADLGTGVVVRYALNYPGLLGGPNNLGGHDYLLAYAANIARTIPSKSQVLYLPVSDPDFWTPGEGLERPIKTVYSGKYVDFHKQVIPRDVVTDALIITRDKVWSQTRDELRDIFRKSYVLHVFENTALATEAALCGCPVVCHINPYFTELIAAEELGLDGFTFSSMEADLQRASDTVASFRACYGAAIERVEPALRSFVRATQDLAEAAPIQRAILPQSRALRMVERASYHVRRLTISLEEIGFLATLQRGSRGLWLRLIRNHDP